jgi:hypothetical protein
MAGRGPGHLRFGSLPQRSGAPENTGRKQGRHMFAMRKRLNPYRRMG